MRGSVRTSAWDGWASSGQIDLGNAPPLSVGSQDDEQPVHRAVSLRWLSGTVLTGLTSIFLMGGALMAALDGRHQLAIPAEIQAGRGLDGEAIAANGKGDRIPPAEIKISTRQIVQVSTVSRQGDRDLIKLRPFARISASLSLRPDEFTKNVPPFDPLKFAAEGSIEDTALAERGAGDQIYGADVDGEVTVQISAMPASDPSFDPNSEFKTSEVEQIVHGAVQPIGGEVADLGGLAYADARITVVDPSRDPFAALGVSITTENVTQISKNSNGGLASARSDRVVAVPAKQAVKDILLRNDVSSDEAAIIVTALSANADLGKLPASARLRIGFAPLDADGGPMRPIRVSLYNGSAHQITVARADNNNFVRSGAPEPLADTGTDPQPSDGNGPMPRLYEAIYQTALAQQVPDPLIQDLIKIFSYEVDYQSQVTLGDAIEIFHSMPDPGAERSSEDGILYASITLGGVKKQFYRFRTNDDGLVDYYDADGRSAKKFLMRKPMTTGLFASSFGYRRHPILGTLLLHTGVDWSAPRGTPIMAAGDGVVEKVGPTSGYGNYVMIRHTNGYETGYGHMSAFAKGMAPGVKVRQGQIVGYVGSTGLSTGNHLHYEVRVNEKFVDPLRIRLPRGRSLQGDLLVSFEQERGRLDGFIGHPAAAPGTKLASNR